jgi:hypothetical protein
MRIISNFKDYYDNVSAHGVDTTLVYNRKQEVIPIVDIRGNTSRPVYPYIRHLYNRVEANPMVIGFCGKLYPVVEYKGIYYFCRADLKLEISFWYENELREFWACDTEPSYSSLKAYFSQYPVFLYKYKGRDRVVEINPKLSDYSFYKVVDPFTAYQEIVQFLGTFVHPDSTTSEPLTEKQSLQKHGMDNMSFKKPKSKKR